MRTTAATIRTTIEDEITSGDRQPGERIPPVRELATELGVSPNTVAAAYRQLRERGIVVGKGRQGTIVAPVRRPPQSQVSIVPDGAVDALRGSPDTAFLPDLGPAFVAATATHDVRYGDALFDDGFLAAARQLFEVDGIDAENLTVTSGAMDAIEKILAANDLRPGDRVGVEDPGHVPVHQIVRAAGLELVPLPIDEFGILPGALSSALTSGLSALIVTPRAQNPTGAAFDETRATRLSEVLSASPELLLIQDDHAGLVSGVDWWGLSPPGMRHATIRSLGKALGPDLRISITVADERTTDRVAMAVSNGPGWVSHLLQRAAAYLLNDAKTSKLFAAAAVSYTSRRSQLIESLAEKGVAATGRSGLNVWIPVGDEQAAIEAARGAGFAIRGADAYRIDSSPAVRVTISGLTSEQISDLATAITTELPGHYSPAI